MEKRKLTLRTALLFALGLTLLINLLFLILAIYGRSVIPMEGIETGPGHGHNGWRFVVSVSFNFSLSFVLYVINFMILRREEWPFSKRLPLVIVCTLAAASVFSYFMALLQWNLFDHQEDHPINFFIRGSMTRDLFLAVLVVFSSQLLYISNKKQQIALENEKLLAENIRTRYEVLKNQVDPHFLFNSLNTLNSIIRVDVDKAQHYVLLLSAIFRYTLQSKEVVPLYEELNFTRTYSSLMEIRYGQSLRIDFEVEDRYLDYLVIPFGVQTLIENAIKHNIVSNREPLVITVATSGDDTISVSNPVRPKKQPETGERIGLSNLSERYRLKWQKDIVIEKSNECFRIILPLIRP